jgi:hypothetical protein
MGGTQSKSAQSNESQLIMSDVYAQLQQIQPGEFRTYLQDHCHGNTALFIKERFGVSNDTPLLHICVLLNLSQHVAVLLELGQDVEEKDQYNQTALQFSSSSTPAIVTVLADSDRCQETRQLPLTQLLIEHKANVWARRSFESTSALEEVMKFRPEYMYQFGDLSQLPGDVQRDGVTPVMLAAYYGVHGLLRNLLLAPGGAAKIRGSRDKYGGHVLDYAQAGLAHILATRPDQQGKHRETVEMLFTFF